MTRMARLAAAVLLIGTTACSDRRNDADDAADRVGEATEEAARDVREEAREAGDEIKEAGRDLRAYTYAQRDDFRTEVRRQIAEVDDEVAELGRDTRGAAGTLSADANSRIKDARAALDRELNRVDDAAEDDWNDVRDGVERSLTELRQTLADIRGSAGPMGGRAAGQN
jgi:uncharacterized membrane protein YccC